MFLRNLCYRCNISNREQRVCRAFHIDRFYIFIDRRFHRCSIGGIHNLVGDTEMLEYIIQNAEGTAVDIVGNHQFVTALKKGKNGIDRRESRSKCQSVLSLLQICDQFFHCGSGGIAGSGIFPATVLSQAVLLVSRCLIYRNVYGSRCFVAVDSAVN